MFIFRKCICLLTGHLSLQATSRRLTPSSPHHHHCPASISTGLRRRWHMKRRRQEGQKAIDRTRHKEHDAITIRKHQASTSRSTRGGGEDRYKNRERASVQGTAALFHFFIYFITFLFNSRTSQHKGAENQKLYPHGCIFSFSAPLLFDPSCTRKRAHIIRRTFSTVRRRKVWAYEGTIYFFCS